MKYRKVGLRLCIISIIMIALCIPNQIQTANAEERVVDVVVYDEDGEWDTDTKLKVFKPYASGNTWISPGDGEKSVGEEGYEEDQKKTTYSFTILNQTSFDVSCELVISEDNQKNYPIEYKLLNSEGKQVVDNDWVNLSTRLKYTTTIKDNSRESLILKWRFRDTGQEVEDGTYTVKLNVLAKQITNSNNNGNNSNNNQGNNTNNGNDGTNGNGSSNSNQGNNRNNKDNLNIDKTSGKGTGSTETNKKKVNTSDITTPVIYVALMIMMFGLILLVKSRKEN